MDVQVAKSDDALDELSASLLAAVAEEEAITEDDLLADLNSIGAEPEAPAVETPMVDISDEELMADLDAKLTRDELYAEQESTSDVETKVVETGDVTTASIAKKVRSPRAASTGTPVVRDLSSIPEEVFVRLVADKADGARSAMMTMRPVQVKVAEKFDNLFISLAAGKEPSRYTTLAFKRLREAGSVTSSDLIATMKAEGLGDGTARSQTGQMMALFEAVGMARRSGQTITLNPDSAVAEKLAKVLK